MATAFNKYQGTGNDFIILDNRNNVFNPGNAELINRLCDRRFGIGADGLILIGDKEGFDYEMIYFNSDGFRGTMCGNGGRCAAAFALKHGIAGTSQRFLAPDGIHEARSENNIIRLTMSDVKNITRISGNYFINTGSPHYVVFTSDLDNLDVFSEGRKIRWSDEFKPGGTNVNFVEIQKDGIFVRTFERGVEDETLSCGTGVTASAIASVLSGHFVSAPVNVRTRGGELKVEFEISSDMITGIKLCGPATFVFEGTI
ncbi:MAG: diaminopimelate epimerase [Bacteroidales bacterium]|nr:diaminopimelate epimerase [Bacteroidales bacterium]